MSQHDENSTPTNRATQADTVKGRLRTRGAKSATENTAGRYNDTEPWVSSLKGWRKMATADLSGTNAAHCEIKQLIQAAFCDAIKALEHKSSNRPRNITSDHPNPADPHPNHKNTHPSTTMTVPTNTPAAKLKLVADTFAADDQLDPTRNLED